jgi:hypothetical protein
MFGDMMDPFPSVVSLLGGMVMRYADWRGDD